jgi:hypothetical protein
MPPEDLAGAIRLCVLMPGRTLIEEVVMSPTADRDRRAEIEAARLIGAPDGAP